MSIAAQKSIANRLSLALLGMLTLLFITMFLVMASGLESRLSKSAREDLSNINTTVVDLVDAYRLSVVDAVKHQDGMWSSQFPQEWSLVNGQLRHGAAVLADGNERADRFTAASGSVATIFVREGDGFRRIATSVKKEDGSRAVGTMLDSAHPALPLLLQGKPYIGIALLFGRNYMTAYRPILDKAGQVVGVLFVGTDFSDGIADLKQKLARIKPGQQGYVYVVESAGKNKGKVVIHPAEKDGNVLENPETKVFAADMLERKNGIAQYSYRGARFEAAFATLQDLNWMVVSVVPAENVLANALWAEKLVGAACVVVAILLALATRLMLAAWLRKPLQEVVTHLEAFASGDFSHTIRSGRNDEVGAMLAALEVMQRKLGSMLQGVQDGAQKLLVDAEKVGSSSQQVAVAISDQSAAAAAMTSTVEELTVSIQQIADSAHDAHDVSANAGAVSASGSGIIQQTVSGIRSIAATVRAASDNISELGEHAQQISSIVLVIKEIADQTNLLALNAAIEAARAGEQGRGFAVVADEVRKLAERTSVSTQEIATMIDKIQQGARTAVESITEGVAQVSQGVELASEAGGAMDKIREGSGRVVEVVDSINQALKEQSDAARDVARHVETIAQMSEQNSIAVNQSAAIAASLRRLALELNQTAEQFKLR